MVKKPSYSTANWRPGRSFLWDLLVSIVLVAGGFFPPNLLAQPIHNSYKDYLSVFFLNHPEHGKPISHYDSLSQHSPYLVDQFFGLLGGAYLMYRRDAAGATTRLVQAKTLLHNKPELKAYQGYLYTFEGLLSAQVENFEAASNLYQEGLAYAKAKNLTEMRWLIQNWYAASLMRAENYASGYNLLNSTLNEVNNANPKQALFLEEIKLELLSNQSSVLTALSFEYPDSLKPAQDALKKVILQAKKANNPAVYYNAMGNLSYVHLRQGNYPEVLPLAQADLMYSLEQGRLSSAVALHTVLGKAHLALNQNDSVAYHLEQANHYIQYVRQASILAEYTDLAQQYYYQNEDIEGGFAALQNQFDALNELVRHRQEQTLNLLQAESELKLANQRLSGLEVQNSQNRKINWLLGGVLVMLSLLVYSYFRRHVVQKRYNRQLAQLNQNLEAEVVNRTREITHQNERIKQIAFQNSHILRAPVARLLGLSNLLTYQLTADELRIIIDYIKESSQEADKVIYEMNRLLDEAEEASYRQN